MASKCFYLNVFYVVFILFTLTVETLSDSGNKNESPPIEKVQVTKKPTSLDLKPTSIPTDLDQKQKASGITKKDSLSTKISSTTPPSPVPVHHETVNPQLEDFHDGDPHLEKTGANSTSANLPQNATSRPVAPPAKKIPETMLTNITVADGDIEVNKFLELNMNEMELNETIKDHNITMQKVDHHLYYNSSILYSPEMFHRYWVDMDKVKDARDILSKSHRKAVTLKLSFDFPFYGHLVKKIIIATGGFLYTGEYAHSWLSVTQYVAPFMANFDTMSSNYSSIRYVDNGTAFTVHWENVVLQDKPEEGNFTFQCTLFNNGDIVFVYKHISGVIDKLAGHHPIKIGVSDAYIIDRTIFLVRRKTIYEYHRVNIEKDEIRNETVILLNALDTCLDMKDCHSCVTEIPNFECNWCEGRCSNGMDRYRQDWLAKGCSTKKRKTVEECLAEEEPLSIVQPRSSEEKTSQQGESMNIGIAGIMGILFLLCLALGTGIWLFYAYRNPHTPAGQFLIRYRPSQWSWRRGEARYTAATIHM